jgi:hypothetical protein
LIEWWAGTDRQGGEVAEGSQIVDFNRFDVSAKELVWEDPVGWLEGLGIGPIGPVEVIESDITALTAAADKVLRVGGDSPYLVNIELQSSHQTDLARTLWFRQVALDYRHGLPVLTVLVLLRKEANSPALTGSLERRLPDGRLTNRYDYQVVRLWREPAEPFLTGSVGLLPLAPLADVEPTDLPALVQRMAARINQEPRPRAAKLWTATSLLMGLRFPDEQIAELLEGIMSLRESTTYQAILREGHHLEVDANHQYDCGAQYRLGQSGRHWRPRERRFIHPGRVDTIPRTLAGLLLGDIALGSWRRQGSQGFACGTVTDDDHIPSLAIAATRRKAGILQDLEERSVW